MRIVVLLAINISFHLASGEYVLQPPQPASDSRLAESQNSSPPTRPATSCARKELLINPAA